jgi:DNA (cytosine-5)-methyltransferase 1
VTQRLSRARLRDQAVALRQWPLDGRITVVLFAGLGGACAGLEEAGCPVAVAVNHDAVAIAAHAELHPHTKHVRGDIFDVDPLAATGGRAVKFIWASPDCRDHSAAKGDAPRSPRVRSMPWQICRWIGKTDPEVVMVENVSEIRGWGPLVAKRCRTTGRVMKLDGTVAAPGEQVPVWEQQLVRDRRRKRQGRTFKRWVAHMRRLGCDYEDRDLTCADYGVPTRRRRFFAIGRRDGLPIAWPARTHAPPAEAATLGLVPWRTAAEIIDWSLPCPSIFSRPRPLVEATHRRIAVGLRRYVLENPTPFLVPVTHQGDARCHGLDEPLRTLTTAQRGEFALIMPKLAAWVVQHNLGAVGARADAPLSTLLTRGTQQQVAVAYLAHLRGTGMALSAQAPIPTLTAGGEHVAVVAAFLSKYYGTGGVAQGCDEPLHTLVQLARFGVVQVQIQGEPYALADIGMRMLSADEAAAAHELVLPKLITVGGKRRPLTKSEGMRLVGNSVPKRMARLLAEANIVHALEAAPRARKAA